MRMNRDFAITRETMMILPNYTNGELRSLVCRTDKYVEVAKPPYQLIDYNLLYRGTSLRGAMEGSNDVLGKITMHPIIIDYDHEIILFPCKSPFRKDCIWFSLRHVYATEGLKNKQTLVTLSNGSTIVVDISLETFENKLRKAYELRFKMDVRRELGLLDELAMDTPYHLFKATNGVNYEEKAGLTLSFSTKMDYKKSRSKK
ncbi:Competence transcription factor [Planococcus massiliensis]|uniref:Competence transcription factor n=1 Tax=Planococcus massiliensis TaxID=1499687 RepID=A0A098EJS2_9BACL|nr:MULTISPECIES: competence protein ComK [Planococcus]MCJ1908298.1 competence protein ComK [Planococcus ruber]CEG22050.1 Competence transcription factor [Planococcus massiliensis]